MKEEVYTFGNRVLLKGILTTPNKKHKENNKNPPGIILINAGLVHRIGPNRIYVKIARELASIGFFVFRFDLSSIGDSNFPEEALLSVEENYISDTIECMNYLNYSHGINNFVLAGICSGAAIAFKTAYQDQRVIGAIFINTFNTFHDSHDQPIDPIKARTFSRHYIRMIIFSSFSGKNFLKALKGKIDYRNIFLKIFSTLKSKILPKKLKINRPAKDDSAIIKTEVLIDRGVRILHIYSEGSEGLDYFHVVFNGKIETWLSSGKIQMEIIKGADHVFSLCWSHDTLLKIIRKWINSNREKFIVEE